MGWARFLLPIELRLDRQSEKNLNLWKENKVRKDFYVLTIGFTGPYIFIIKRIQLSINQPSDHSLNQYLGLYLQLM